MKEKKNSKGEKESRIELNSDSFTNQKERLIREFDVSSTKADAILELIKKYVLPTLEKENKSDWSEDVKDTFINMMTTIFIELVLVIEGEEKWTLKLKGKELY